MAYTGDGVIGPENDTFHPGVLQWGDNDKILGGPPNFDVNTGLPTDDAGIDNVPIQQLVDRTRYLYNAMRMRGGESRLKNCILRGPVNAVGQNILLVQTVNNVNANPSGAVVVLSFAGGYDPARGPVDWYVNSVATQNINFTGLSTGSYLYYADYNPATGVLTYDKDIVRATPAALFQNIINPQNFTTVTTGDYWYDQLNNLMKRYDGAQWVVVVRIPLGYVTVSAGAVTGFSNLNLRANSDISYDVPPGTIVPYAAHIGGAAPPAPEGWIKCNGALLQRAAYGRLFGVIGTVYGSTNSSNFNVPDLRAEFIRGLDDGRGIDASRILGSLQQFQVEGHTHFGAGNAFIWVNSGGNQSMNPGGGVAQPVSSTSQYPPSITGPNETRPRNIALHFLIKY